MSRVVILQGGINPPGGAGFKSTHNWKNLCKDRSSTSSSSTAKVGRNCFGKEPSPVVDSQVKPEPAVMNAPPLPWMNCSAHWGTARGHPQALSMLLNSARQPDGGLSAKSARPADGVKSELPKAQEVQRLQPAQKLKVRQQRPEQRQRNRKLEEEQGQWQPQESQQPRQLPTPQPTMEGIQHGLTLQHLSRLGASRVSGLPLGQLPLQSIERQALSRMSALPPQWPSQPSPQKPPGLSPQHVQLELQLRLQKLQQQVVQEANLPPSQLEQLAPAQPKLVQPSLQPSLQPPPPQQFVQSAFHAPQKAAIGTSQTLDAAVERGRVAADQGKPVRNHTSEHELLQVRGRWDDGRAMGQMCGRWGGRDTVCVLGWEVGV